MIVCNEEVDMTEQEIRAMRVAEAVHSARMEDARDYIEEQIDAHELVNRTRRRYGLESV